MIRVDESVAPRVQGLPIRVCARGCINRGYIWLQLCAIDVTEKTFFERLYLVLGLRKIALCVNCPYAPTTPTIHCTTISRFLCNFFPRMSPHFFCPSFTKEVPSPRVDFDCWLRQLPHDKCPGDDELTYAMWQEAPAKMKDALYQIVNQVVQNGKMPTSWEGALTTLIPKKFGEEKI